MADLTPVLLVHGSGMEGGQWYHQRRALGPDRLSVAPNLLGYRTGESWRATSTFTLADDLALLKQTADALGQRFHLVGHSYGAYLSLKLAVALGDRVASLSIYEPSAFSVLYSYPDPQAIASFEASIHPFLGYDPETDDMEKWMVGFLRFWQGPGAWEGLTTTMRNRFLRTATKIFHEVRCVATDPTPHTTYASISCPTLVMCGTTSPSSAQRVAAILNETIPNARLSVLEGAGHVGPLTHTETVTAWITSHIHGCEASV